MLYDVVTGWLEVAEDGQDLSVQRRNAVDGNECRARRKHVQGAVAVGLNLKQRYKGG